MNGRLRRCVVDDLIFIAALFLSLVVDLVCMLSGHRRAISGPRRRRGRARSGRRRRRSQRRDGSGTTGGSSATNRAASDQSSSAPIPMAAITAAPSEAPGWPRTGSISMPSTSAWICFHRRGLGSAVGDHHPARPDADVGEHVDVMPEAERDGLQHRAVQVGPGVPEVHAGERRRAGPGRAAGSSRRGSTAGTALRPARDAAASSSSTRQLVAADQRLEPADQAAAGGHAAVG